MALNRKKYQNAILYFCSKLNGEIRGKKKLAKLLYFADFDLFEKDEKVITGDVYKALPMGPYPVSLVTITDEMEKKKLLDIQQVEEAYGLNPTEVYKSKKAPDMSVFTKDEKAILDRVLVKYGQLTGKQLENLTHAEAPYIGTDPTKEIAFELAHYRGTDFSDV